MPALPQTKLLPLVVLLAAFVCGCATPPAATTSQTAPSAAAQANVLEGKLRLKSSNGKTLTVDIVKDGEPKVVTLRYDEKSKGIGQVVNGYPVSIAYETRADGMPYTSPRRKPN